jgi:hypothetical protein
MSSRKIAFIGVLVIGLLMAAGAILLWPVPASSVTISIAATPGTKITGNYEVDGVKSQIDTEAPMQIVATGREVTCSIHEDKQSSELTVRVSVGKKFASATAGPGQGVNVGFRRRGNWLTRSDEFWANTSQVAK